MSPASTSLDELVGLRALAAALARRRRTSAAPLAGGTASRRLGRGLDFAEVRAYRPGDDVRQIDWKVTARTGHPHTKLFVEERERPVYLVVDFRSAMRFGTRGMYKSVLAARLAAIVGWSAVAARDRTGGFVFTDDWHAEVRPETGRRGLMGLFRATVHAQNRIPSAGGVAQFGDTLKRLAKVVHPGSTVYLFSDFKDFDGPARQTLGGALRRQELVAVHIVDPLDERLPEHGRLAVTGRSASGAPVRLAIDSTRQRRAYIARFEARRAALESLLGGSRKRLVTASTATPIADSAARLLARGDSSG